MPSSLSAVSIDFYLELVSLGPTSYPTVFSHRAKRAYSGSFFVRGHPPRLVLASPHYVFWSINAIPPRCCKVLLALGMNSTLSPTCGAR